MSIRVKVENLLDQPKTEVEILKEENEVLQRLVSQTSSDFSEFMDFFFQAFPDLS